MATQTWTGGSNGWTDPAGWAGDVVPALDDTAIIPAGTVAFDPGETLEAATIDIGSDSASAPAAIVLDDALLGYCTTLDSTAARAQAELVDIGTSGFSGVINATASGGSFNIVTDATGSTEGALTLLNGASLTVSGGDSMLLDGTLINHSDVTVGSGGDFINQGTIGQAAAEFSVESGGTLNGGVFEIGLLSSLYFDAGAAASSETVMFTAAGGRLLLADPADFTGTIGNFETGDLIDLTSIVANGASYDAANGLLTVTENGSVVATLTLEAPAGTGFVTSSDGSGGTLVQLTGSQPRLNYTLDGADQAMGANVVRATMTTPGGTPITGAGVRVGIISDSFDNGTADVANAAAADGYLPANPDGTSAVTVLADAAGGNDEGLAMAELVHQVAPGAAIDFADAGDTMQSYADAVTSLQQAGCNVIVDDVGAYEDSLFQDTSLLSTTINAAVESGVSFFAAAGNEASAAYQATFAPTTTQLYNGTTVRAQIFSNGTPYQTVTLMGGTTAIFDLQYVGASQGLLNAALFTMSDTAVRTAVTPLEEYQNAAGLGELLEYTPTTTAQYQLAIYGQLPAGSTFKYILFGTDSTGGSDFAGTIDDPAANAGTVYGQNLLPDVNSVGAIDFADTSAFSGGDEVPEYYSSTGDPGSGKPDFLAPVDAATTVFPTFAGTSAAAPSAAAVAALMLQANPSLTPAEITADLENTATSIGQPASGQGAGVVNAVNAVRAALGEPIPCFAAGTCIATARGEVAVQHLRIGDRVRLAAGGTAPVVWLGHRRVACRRHRRPADVQPVRISANAFGLGRPHRDLLVSPDHAVFVDGVLIPVRYLLNDATVRQQDFSAVIYWHVELPAHGVLLAAGLPCESYLDTGNRGALASGGVTSAQPEHSRAVWQTRGCAPLITAGEARDLVYRRLLAQAFGLGWQYFATGGGASRWLRPAISPSTPHPSPR